MITRRALAPLAVAPLLAACAGQSAAGDRRFLLVEITRHAQIDGAPGRVAVSACRWHVTRDGALYGDHWGWCEDYQLLPPTAPGYLLLTTLFAGGASGGYARLLVLPALPADVAAFGHTLRLALEDAHVRLELRGARASVTPGQTVSLGSEDALVEPPEDTGHFEPGFGAPAAAQVTYTATHHGWLEPGRIAGRRV